MFKISKKNFRNTYFEGEKPMLDIIQGDRGDHTKTIQRVIRIPRPKSDNETQVEQRGVHIGDAGKAVQLATKTITLRKKANSKYYTPYGIRLTEKKIKQIEEKKKKEIKPLDINTRRRLYHMYTFRRASGDGDIVKMIKDETPANIHLGAFEADKNKHVSNEDSTLKTRTLNEEKATKRVQVQTDSPRSPMPKKCYAQSNQIAPKSERKPLIKTVMDKKGNSTKVYKAVTFMDSKRKRPLKIQIDKTRSHGGSSSQSQQKSASRNSTRSNLSSPKHTQRNTSPSSIEKLVMNRKYKSKNRRKRYTTPEAKAAPPPQTEVAKWAPQSVTQHTKPYYEAWVNTTLAVTSTDSETVRNEKERILEQMRGRLEAQAWCAGWSEEEISDEKHTGRIKVVKRR